MKLMEISSNQTTRAGQLAGCAVKGLLVVVIAFFFSVNVMSHAATDELGQASQSGTQFQFPTVPQRHHHARQLLASALRYIAPENKMIDPVSGYPFEGWNQDPAKGLYLRSFTQLTAIGQYMELLSNIIAGTCDTPSLSRKQALANLAHLVKSLRQDQVDPTLSAGSLLGNFLDLATGKRLGPLAVDVEKHKLQEAFGRDKAEVIWKAFRPRAGSSREPTISRPISHARQSTVQNISTARWLRSARIRPSKRSWRSSTSAWSWWCSSTTPIFPPPRRKPSVPLLKPGLEDQAEIATLRGELERFLEDQQAGYARLYDPQAGQFYFGRDATKNRHFGWVDLQGKWVTGHVDYLVNEFRGPATFVVTRFGLPLDAIRNLGLKMKPYRLQDAREVHVLAPWEGSAFQALGLELAMTELERPSWHKLLENVVDVEIDYSTRHKLPGFLSESYSGEGVQYTGSVGIPEITVSPLPRITDAASLYTLGAAYSVAPEKIEQFLAANWPRISEPAHRAWTVGGAQRSEPGGDSIPDHGPYPVTGPGIARDRVGPHEGLPGVQGASSQAR